MNNPRNALRCATRLQPTPSTCRTPDRCTRTHSLSPYPPSLPLPQGSGGADIISREDRLSRVVALTEGYSGSDLTAVSAITGTALRCTALPYRPPRLASVEFSQLHFSPLDDAVSVLQHSAKIRTTWHELRFSAAIRSAGPESCATLSTTCLIVSPFSSLHSSFLFLQKQAHLMSPHLSS